MKKILLFAITVAALTFNASAQLLYVTNGLAAGARTVVNEAAVMNSITLSGTSNCIIRLYDGALTNVIPAHTNVSMFSTNTVTTYVTTTGITNTFTNTTLYTLLTATAQTTNNANVIASYAITANQVPLTVPIPVIFTKYLTLSNDIGGLNVIINYRQP